MALFRIILCIASILAVTTKADKQCAARQISGQSVVCVCNATYCDEIERQPPQSGQYVAYTSSKDGLRFDKVIGELQDENNVSGKCSLKLTLNPDTKFQTIEGFGGAVTDSAAINWLNLSNANLQQALINSYFGDKGIQYNMVRTPVGGTDFSTRAYAYNELPEDDVTLSNYSLSFEDYEYKIPMIKTILAASSTTVNIFITCWSPPAWMKSNHEITGFSHLKPEYYQTYVDYHTKFLEKYLEEGISIWGMTTTNEPINGVINIASFNTLGWLPEPMGKWIVNNLGPTIRNSTFKDLKIMGHDDQRLSIPLWLNAILTRNPEVLNYIDGIGVHYYTDYIAPAAILSQFSEMYPDKFILATEACEGSFPGSKAVVLGSWARAKSYISNIMQDLNSNVVGWIDWNLCLNSEGGPNWVKNFVDSPIIVLPKAKEFVKQPMFYGLGHFSKFLPRGSQRIEVTEKKPLLSSGVDSTAFLTPNNTVVVVIYNNAGFRKVCLELGNKIAVVTAEANAVVTVELPYEL